MSVTEQQQLKYLAENYKDWPCNKPVALMSCNRLGVSVTSGEDGYFVTYTEWRQERDKIEMIEEIDMSWYTCGEKPPVGCECLIHHAAWCKDKYEKVKIAAITEEYLIVRYASFEQHYPLNQISFKPTQTERDKAIEDMLLVLTDLDGCSLKDIVSALYDAGYDKPFTQGIIE